MKRAQRTTPRFTASLHSAGSAIKKRDFIVDLAGKVFNLDSRQQAVGVSDNANTTLQTISSWS